MFYPSEIIRCKRRTISLIINSAGELIVRAPLRASDRAIFNFVNEKQAWIEKNVNKIISKHIVPLKVVDDEVFYILDTLVTIKLSTSGSVKLVGDKIFVPANNAKQKLIAFLKRFAKQYLTGRVNEIAAKCGFKFNGIKISSAHTNWGSCSSKNHLNFTYKLMLCPSDVVDYIIIHELSHTIVKNHSSKFYSLVSQYDPNYKLHKKWLKDNSAIIDLI